MPMPVTLSDVVEAKKEELGVTQKGLASILGIDAPNYPVFITPFYTLKKKKGLKIE